MKDISVIIPVFNKADHLAECLHSILEVAGMDIEVVLVDDCSTDGSRDIVKRHADENPKKVVGIYFDENRGASAARNAALDVASGKYVFFLDADDIVEPDGLSRMYELAEKYETDVIRGKMTGSLDGKQRILAAEHLLHDADVMDASWETEESLWFYWYFTACLYRRDFLNANNIRFKEGVRNEDPVFLCEVFLAAGKITLIDQIVYRYVLGAEQLNKTPSESFLRGWATGYHSIFKLIRSHRKQLNYFLCHFPSLYAHTNNIVTKLDGDVAVELLAMLHEMFSQADIDVMRDVQRQDWTRRKRVDENHLLMAILLKRLDGTALYDTLLALNGMSPNDKVERTHDPCENCDIQKRLAAVHESASWKLTAPVRALVRFFRGY